jgi:hypothetical protein
MAVEECCAEPETGSASAARHLLKPLIVSGLGEDLDAGVEMIGKPRGSGILAPKGA